MQIVELSREQVKQATAVIEQLQPQIADDLVGQVNEQVFDRELNPVDLLLALRDQIDPLCLDDKIIPLSFPLGFTPLEKSLLARVCEDGIQNGIRYTFLELAEQVVGKTSTRDVEMMEQQLELLFMPLEGGLEDDDWGNR